MWASYRFVVLADGREASGLKVVDLGAGHASGSETLCGRVIVAMRSESLLDESVGAGYIDRNWPPALKDSGAWPLASLRQSFLNGSLTRLLDPDAVLRGKIVEFVTKGDLGVASGPRPDGTYEHVWFDELIAPDEIAFDPGVFLLRKTKARALKQGTTGDSRPTPPDAPKPPVGGRETDTEPEKDGEHLATAKSKAIRLSGNIPPELWNRLGTKILPKLRSGDELVIGIDFSLKVKETLAAGLEADVRQILSDLGLAGKVRVQ